MTTQTEPRELIVVDVEATSLDTNKAAVLEIAAINLTTGDEFYLVPYIERGAIAGADPVALSINRYYERRVFEAQSKSKFDTREGLRELANMLQGNTLAGSNPAFDAAMVLKCFQVYELNVAQPWHHRLADLSAYAAGALGIPPHELPGLEFVLKRLGITNEDPHSAMGDARATAEAFRKVQSGTIR